MVGIVTGLMILALVYIMGVTLALLKEHGPDLVDTFNSVVEAIQDIKSYKEKRTSRGS